MAKHLKTHETLTMILETLTTTSYNSEIKFSEKNWHTEMLADAP